MVHTGNTGHIYDLLSKSDAHVKRAIVSKLYDKETNGHIINSEQHESYNQFLYENLIEN